MRLAITAPVYVANEEHKKYLDLTTKSIVSAKHQIIWMPCENYLNPIFAPIRYVFIQEPKEIRVLHPKGQQSVAKAWNMGITYGSKAGCKYIMVINTDIVFKNDSIDRLVDFAEKHPEAVLWTMTPCGDLVNLERCPEDETFVQHPDFSCFLVKNDIFKHVGTFDENFIPAYCEDGDMYARLVLADFKSYAYNGAKFFHYGSITIKSDLYLSSKNARSYPRCQLYFKEKWGHFMIEDYRQMKDTYFKHPYNQADKPLSYWRQPMSSGFKDALPLSIQHTYVSFLNWTKRIRARIKHV